MVVPTSLSSSHPRPLAQMAEQGAPAAPTAPADTATPDYEALTNTLRPLSDCFLTIRIIKSFTYRTTKNLLLPHVDCTTTTVGQLKDLCRERASPLSLLPPTSSSRFADSSPSRATEVKTAAGFRPFRTVELGVFTLPGTLRGTPLTCSSARRHAQALHDRARPQGALLSLSRCSLLPARTSS